MEIRNKAQAAIAKSFDPKEWDRLCTDSEFQKLFEQAETVQQAEAAIFYGSALIEVESNLADPFPFAPA